MGQNIDLEPIGKKAIGLYKKRFPMAVLRAQGRALRQRSLQAHREHSPSRAPIEVAAEHPTLLLKTNFSEVAAVANSIVARYERAEIDSVYIVYNEFKSVISQRVVVEKLLPIRKLGSQEIDSARRDDRRAERGRR